MSKERGKSVSDKLEKQMYQLAQAKVNDAVKLAFLSQEDRDLIDGMDLSALAELKRGSNGVVEMKFTDRMKTIERLLELSRENPAQKLLVQLSGEAEE